MKGSISHIITSAALILALVCSCGRDRQAAPASLTVGMEIEPSVENFLHQLEGLERCCAEGDSMQIAACYGRLGAYLAALGDFRSAAVPSARSLAIFERQGCADRAVEHNPWLPTLLYQQGERTRAVEMNVRFVELTEQADSRLLRQAALLNQYRITGRDGFLQRGWDVARADTSLSGLRPLYYAIIADNYDVSDRPDSAILYADLALAEYYRSPVLAQRIEINRLLANVLAANGRREQAYDRLDLAMRQADSVERLARMYIPAVTRTLERIDLSAERSSRWRMVAILCGVIVALVVICLALVGRRTLVALFDRRKRRHSEMQQKLGINSVALMAKSLAIKETAGMNARVGREIERLQKENNLTPEASERLTDLLRQGSAGHREWDAFIHGYEDVNPRFMENLRRSHPQLGENYCRLALLVHMGMNNAQIANLLQVKPESVHQSRWRLRRKLGADPDTSLEDWLKLYD